MHAFKSISCVMCRGTTATTPRGVIGETAVTATIGQSTRVAVGRSIITTGLSSLSRVLSEHFICSKTEVSQWEKPREWVEAEKSRQQQMVSSDSTNNGHVRNLTFLSGKLSFCHFSLP